MVKSSSMMILCILFLLVALLPGCTSQEEKASNAVKGYLDAIISTGSSSTGSAYLAHDVKSGSYDAIVGYVVRGYQIKNASGDAISVEVTFESQAHTDLKKTLVFSVNSDGKITSIR